MAFRLLRRIRRRAEKPTIRGSILENITREKSTLLFLFVLALLVLLLRKG